jgi:hypothetical protein
MRPPEPLEYGRSSRQFGQRVPASLRRFRRAIGAGALVGLALYGVSYRSVRQSHTKFWFDKETEQRVFWPACAAERAITGRSFEYDKW